MSALESVVVRQLAGLRRAGWSLGDALEFVHAELPVSPLKARLQTALASLRAGAAAPSGDALVATLARGDAASAGVLEQLAEALEADAEARSATTLVRVGVTVVLSVCVAIVLGVTGATVDTFKELVTGFGAALPAPTQWLFDLAGPLQVASLVGFTLAVVFVWRARLDGMTGGRELRASSLLLQVSSALEAGVGEPAALALVDARAAQLERSTVLRLRPEEQAFLRHVTVSGGVSEAARRLGHELRADGARVAGSFRWWRSPGLIVVVFFTAAFVAATFVALYLPIFSTALAIK
jgi:type II secretory pathway component PulF